MWWWDIWFNLFDGVSLMMTEPIIDSEVVRLPVKRRVSPHKFGAPINFAGRPEIGLLEQTERLCSACGVVKVTVHGAGGNSWREWRRIHGGSQFKLKCEPECASPFSDVAS